MAQPIPAPIDDAAAQARTDRRQDRLLKTGLIGAGALTLTWWVVIGCGIWRAIEWAVA